MEFHGQEEIEAQIAEHFLVDKMLVRVDDVHLADFVMQFLLEF